MRAADEHDHAPRFSRRSGWPVVLVLASLASLFALLQVAHKAERGQQALLKWRADFERLERGEDIYHALDLERADVEGYPTPPLTALLLKPLLTLGPVAGCVAFAGLKLALCWFLFWAAFRLAAGRAHAFPAWAALVCVLLSCRVLLSDLAHGNINILVGACVVASALAWNTRRDLQAGLWAALGAALKLTPALLLLYFIRKRSWRAALGFAFGLALFTYVIPGLALGFGHNAELVASWARQMLGPAFSEAPLTLVQTEHVNQSGLGVLARLFSHSLAIPARAPVHVADVYVNVLSLQPAGLRALVLAFDLLVLAWLWIGARPRSDGSAGERDGARVLGEYAMLALAMCFVSERSWKQHYVLLLLPIAFLLFRLQQAGRLRWSCALALVLSLVLNGLSGSGVLGDRGSDLAEAWGVWFLGALGLFVACALELASIAVSVARKSP